MALRCAFVGWRGMVGSVLLERMRSEGDFADLDSTFFSTSQAGQPGPPEAEGAALRDASDLEALARSDAIVTCQGGSYTDEVLPALRREGWRGFWIDAASARRMHGDSVIVLDPVNRHLIDGHLDRGGKDFIGGNCTVSLFVLGLHGLFREDLVEWVTTASYQAASGAGARAMKQLVAQMKAVGEAAAPLLADPASTALEVDQRVSEALRGDGVGVDQFGGVPLAGSVLPFIDRMVEGGESREEWKGFAETNKILGRVDHPIPIDSTCVRVGAMRSHAQAFTMKLRRDVPLEELESIIAEANPWASVVPNDRERSLTDLTPTRVSGTLAVPVGRLRKLRLGPRYLGGFTVGDQLLWGAAEPLRRMLRILVER
ncbi:MAG: aspartate-semialdehyde dehydrogenase [Myxococcota bacterium]